MSGKRPSLAESMRQAAIGAAPPAAPEPPPPTPAPPLPIKPPKQPSAAPPAEEAPRPAGFYAATRAGKKKVTATLDPAAHKQLKGLAVEETGQRRPCLRRRSMTCLRSTASRRLRELIVRTRGEA